MRNAWLGAGALATAAFALVVAGCGGGGGTAPSSPPAGAYAAPGSAPASTGKVTLSIAIPIGRQPSRAARAPLYVSEGLQTLAFYDGATLVYTGTFSDSGAPQFTTTYTNSGTVTTLAPGSCDDAATGGTTFVCTLSVTAPVGQHKFDIVTYGTPVVATPLPGPSTLPDARAKHPLAQASSGPSSPGIILSEGELATTVASGTNPPATLTLLGVADQVVFADQGYANFDETVTVSYQVLDAAAFQIVQPGNYDNGPVTITASPAPLVSIAPVSQNAPPSGTGDQTFNLTCASENGGQVTITATAQAAPNTAYASGLTYSTSNYAPTTLGTTTFNCNGT